MRVLFSKHIHIISRYAQIPYLFESKMISLTLHSLTEKIKGYHSTPILPGQQDNVWHGRSYSDAGGQKCLKHFKVCTTWLSDDSCFFSCTQESLWCTTVQQISCDFWQPYTSPWMGDHLEITGTKVKWKNIRRYNGNLTLVVTYIEKNSNYETRKKNNVGEANVQRQKYQTRSF